MLKLPLQSKRWEEFCRMATNMKSLSSDMLQQSAANKTSWPAHRS